MEGVCYLVFDLLFEMMEFDVDILDFEVGCGVISVLMALRCPFVKV